MYNLFRSSQEPSTEEAGDSKESEAKNTMKGDATQMQSQADGAKGFYSTGDYSDLTISCKEKEWKVHKFQLCAQSEFFHTACSGKFKEGHENKIALDDDDPQVVEALLQYLYTGHYGDPGNSPTDMSSILLDVSMFAIADKYFIGPLKTKAAEKFAAHCQSEWRTSEFAEAIEEVYITAPQDGSMREIVVDTVRKRLTTLLDTPNRFEDFHRVLRSTSSFSADVVVAIGALDAAIQEGMRHTDLGKTDKFKWSFECPQNGCDSTFVVKVPLGMDTSFACPLGHHRQTFSWWKTHGEHTA